MRGYMKLETRRIPNPPNFKRMAARIIEPATGASTWAFGSHKWVRNIGSFTKKARSIKRDQKRGSFKEKEKFR